MSKGTLIFYLIWTVTYAQDYHYHPHNVSRSTLSGLAAYRSALTLDWLAAQDSWQRDRVAVFETDPPPARFISTDCATYPKPSTGKIGRLMLELLKNLESDDGTLISDLTLTLVRAKLLVETSALEVEPDFDALVKTPGLMAGEPHSTFPKIVAVIWMLVTDSSVTGKNGWCPVKQVNRYLAVARPRDVAKHMKALEMIVARARFVMEEFIQHITPVEMYQKKQKTAKTRKLFKTGKQRMPEKRPRPPPKSFIMEPVHKLALRQPQSPSSEADNQQAEATNPTPIIDGGLVMLGNMEPIHQLALLQSPSPVTEAEVNLTRRIIDNSFVMLENGGNRLQITKILIAFVCFLINCF